MSVLLLPNEIFNPLWRNKKHIKLLCMLPRMMEQDLMTIIINVPKIMFKHCANIDKHRASLNQVPYMGIHLIVSSKDQLESFMVGDNLV